MSYLCYLCLFAYSGVQLILCCVFVFVLVFVLCSWCSQFIHTVFILRKHGSIIMTNIAGYINRYKNEQFAWKHIYINFGDCDLNAKICFSLQNRENNPLYATLTTKIFLVRKYLTIKMITYLVAALMSCCMKRMKIPQW